MQSLIIKNAIQALCFGIGLSVVNFFTGRFTSLDMVAKNFVIYTVVFFALSLIVDLLFKKNRK